MTEAQREPSVEEALKELRELFPSARWITISGDYTSHVSGSRNYSTRIQAAVQGAFFKAPTLSETMVQVRQWYKEQSRET